jgi:DNA-binding beta-propeller fold protein YncE
VTTRRPRTLLAVGLAMAMALLLAAACSDDDGAASDRSPEAPGWRTTAVQGRPSAIAIAADGEVLVVDDGQGLLQRIGVEPEPEVDPGLAPGGALVGVAEAGGGVWVILAQGSAVRVGQPAASATLGGTLVDVVGAGDVLYVGDLETGVVHEVDAATGAVRRTLAVPGGVVRLALDGPRLWVSGTERTVTAVDLATGTPGPPVEVGNGPIGLAVADGTVWVANGDDGTVSRLDAATGARRGPDIAVGSGPIAVEVHGDDVWVLDQDSSELTHLRASTGRVVDTTALPPELTRARDLAVAPEGVYVVGVDAPVLAFLPTT